MLKRFHQEVVYSAAHLAGEIIQIHVGQAGVQMANACWELYCLEHGITVNGRSKFPDNSYNTFFGIASTGRVVPRLVMVDTEPTAIDEIRSGYYRHLFNPSTLITGKEDAASNFARGYKVIGPELIGITMDTVRRVAETCSQLQGFIIFRSIGGGTGGGLGSLILEKLTDDYGKRLKFECEIFPSPTISPVIVEPYNAVLTTHASMDFCNCVFLIDNEALYDVCATKLDVKTPTYTNLNRLIGQVVSSLTAPLRFEGQANVSFLEMETNLVPYPRIHYPMVTYAPIVSARKATYEQHTARQVTFACFDGTNQLVKCHPHEGQFMACVLLYRGDVSPTDVNNAIQDIKRTKGIRFANWAPTGFKFGINNQPPTYVPGGNLAPTKLSLCMLSSNTAIREAWCRITDKFQKMFAHRAFVHHYVGEGLEEGYLTEAKDNLCTLVEDYVFMDDEPNQAEADNDDTDSLNN